jgi:hypothetical protein
MTPGLKTILNFGACIGLMDFIVFLILYLAGYNPTGPGVVSSILTIILMVWGVKSYRIYQKENYISYLDAFLMLMGIALSGALLFGLFEGAFGLFIDDSIVEMKINQAAEDLGAWSKLMGREWYERNLSELEARRTSINLGIVILSELQIKSLYAFFFSFIVAFFIRKQKPFFEETN